MRDYEPKVPEFSFIIFRVSLLTVFSAKRYDYNCFLIL